MLLEMHDVVSQVTWASLVCRVGRFRAWTARQAHLDQPGQTAEMATPDRLASLARTLGLERVDRLALAACRAGRGSRVCLGRRGKKGLSAGGGTVARQVRSVPQCARHKRINTHIPTCRARRTATHRRK
jgi:hypothetical protein